MISFLQHRSVMERYGS